MTVKKKILIVEDDHLIATIFRMFLKELNYELIDILNNSEDAVEKIPLLNPDIILMDILINGQHDGIEVSEVISHIVDVPIIFITSNIEDEIVKRAVNVNAYGFLVKPIDKIALGISIELAYAKHKSDSELISSEHLFNQMIMLSPDPILLIDDGKIEFVNNRAIDLFKISSPEIIKGQYIYDFFDKSHAETLKDHLNNAFLNKKIINQFPSVFLSVDKERINVAVTGSVIEHIGKNMIQLIIRQQN